MSQVVYPVLLFGVLVFFHELGHFLAAKRFNVKVEKFSLGFGPRLFGFRRGETEYRISLIPFGGYVKMLGENPMQTYSGEDASRAFSNQTLFRRAVIVAMGPLFNLILPLVLFSITFATGWPFIPSVVGDVVVGSPAHRGGLRTGDEILSVNGEAVQKWEELTRVVKANAGKNLTVAVLREDKPLDLTITPDLDPGETEYGEKKNVGRIGILSIYSNTTIAVPNAASPAYFSGLRTGDKVVRVGEREVSSFPEIEAALRSTTAPVVITAVRRGKKLAVSLPAGVSIKQSGILSINLLVNKVMPKSPAEQAGLRKDDFIATINDAPFMSWQGQRILFSLSSAPLRLKVQRPSGNVDLVVQPAMMRSENRMFSVDEEFGLGFSLYTEYKNVDLRYERYTNPLTIIRKSFSRTVEICNMTVVGMYKLFRGDISHKTVGGVILMYKISSSVEDFLEFLRLVAVMSISLGILNLLPVPVLDGGHLMFFAYEGIFRRRVNMRIWELAQQTGFMLLMLLIVFTFYNDIMRFFF